MTAISYSDTGLRLHSDESLGWPPRGLSRMLRFGRRAGVPTPRRRRSRRPAQVSGNARQRREYVAALYTQGVVRSFY